MPQDVGDLVPRHPRLRQPRGVLHDWLCVQLVDRHRGQDPRSPGGVTARDTDGLFRRVMREAGVGLVVRWVMWVGVRWGALANPARRAGWWRDTPAVVGLSALVLAATCTAIWGADRALHTITDPLTG
jgi:hypothetical protein